MIRGLDNAVLLGDLEADNNDLLNVEFLDGTGSGLISSDDARLSDARPILDGSVYDWGVADGAAIDQTKVDFGGDIPIEWLGTTETTAAQGDLVELLANKNQPNGYAGLEVDGKMATGTVPLAGAGRVTDIKLSMPVYDFAVVPLATGTDRTFTISWTPQNPYTYLTSLDGVTQFSGAPFDATSIPDLDAAKITTGTIELEHLPAAVGVGASHASGVVPDPSDSADQVGLLPTDYLARDMTYRKMETPMTYQPQIPNPSITLVSYFKGQAYVTITTGLKGATLFYSLDNGAFQEATTLPLLQDAGVMIHAYAAKDGWNNSNIVDYVIPAVS